MPDMAAIGALLGSVKTATEIAKFIRESDVSIERAEMKLKVADLISALADVKMELVEFQEAFAAKDERIRELEEAFQTNASLVRRWDAYYTADMDGEPAGAPFCVRCWDIDHKQRRLVHDAKDYRTRICIDCGHRYENRLASDIAAKKSEEGDS